MFLFYKNAINLKEIFPIQHRELINKMELLASILFRQLDTSATKKLKIYFYRIVHFYENNLSKSPF